MKWFHSLHGKLNSSYITYDTFKKKEINDAKFYICGILFYSQTTQ